MTFDNKRPRGQRPQIDLGYNTFVDKQYYVYMMTTITNSALYIGVTNDLQRRAFEHREGFADGFTRRYKIFKLVYYEAGEGVEGAIAREKQLKKLLRRQKEALINDFNPEWRDLYNEL
jgi:putative endonuclease